LRLVADLSLHNDILKEEPPGETPEPVWQTPGGGLCVSAAVVSQRRAWLSQDHWLYFRLTTCLYWLNNWYDYLVSSSPLLCQLLPCLSQMIDLIWLSSSVGACEMTAPGVTLETVQ
jgi:hypothetical protein